ncbi:FAD binding domain-containing protein [Streptomyces albus]
MEFLLPRDRQEALELMAGRPGTVPVAGGTDVMVGWNMSRGLPARALDLSRLGHLSRRRYGEGRYRLGANTTYSTLTDELRGELPGLAAAAGAVGAPGRSATGAPSGGVWARPGPPPTRTPPCWPAGPRSNWPPYAAAGACRYGSSSPAPAERPGRATN